MNMLEALSDFYAAVEFEVKPGTLRWYRNMLNPLADAFPDTALADVTAADLRRWRRAVFSRDISDSTRNAHLRACKRFFRYCLDEGIITSNPAERLKLLRLTNADKKSADLADFQKILAEAKSKRHWRNVAMILFLLGTGARVSAMISLKVKHLDLVNGRAWVLKKSRKLDERYWVYLDAVVVDAIRDYFAYERRNNLRDDDFVFTNGRGRGEPLHRGSIWQILKKYGTDVGASGPVNPHAFRHAFAILRLQAGEDISSLRDLLGHSSIEVTVNSYGRFQADQLARVHSAFSPLNQLSEL